MESNIFFNNSHNVNGSSAILMPDAHACQAFCKSNSQPFFSWFDHTSPTEPGRCYCKSSDSDRESVENVTSGVAQGCGGGTVCHDYLEF